MARFLFILGIIFFGFSLIFFIMNFIGEYDGLILIWSSFGMLNASIAMGVSEIISLVKNKGRTL